MKALTLIFACLFTSSCATMLPSFEFSETLDVKPPEMDRWTTADQWARNGVSLTEFIPVGQSLKNWNEMLTIEYRSNRIQPESLSVQLKNTQEFLLKTCPELVWNVIEQKDNDVLYEWQIDGCTGNDTQHELARYVAGKNGTHRVRYTRKVSQIADENRGKWLNVLRQSYVIGQ